jgi:ribonuclease P protein component
VIVPKQFTLGRNERLKSRKQIEQLFSKGQRFVVPLYRVFYSFQVERKMEGGSLLQAGFGASSRNFKTAVHRNRIKRLTREAYRVQKHALQQNIRERGKPLSIFFIYIGKTLPAYADVCASVDQALARMEEIMTKRS